MQYPQLNTTWLSHAITESPAFSSGFPSPPTAPFALFSQAFSLFSTMVFGTRRITASKAFLPSYPLAVKSPYLSAWVPGVQLDNAAAAQAEFWAGQPLTWPTLARVDGVTYSLFGVPEEISDVQPATTESVSYTSSHTLIQLSAGTVNITLDFFSTVLPGPDDYARQSLPYSYLTVSAHVPKRQPSDVQLFSGIDQTWTAQHGAAGLNFTSADTAGYFQFHNPNEVPFTEVNDQATYGSIIYATAKNSKTSHACGPVSDLFTAFVTSGRLDVVHECSPSHLAAFASDLGSVSGRTRSVTFAVGFDRPQAINYLGKTQTGVYRAHWPAIADAAPFFVHDYENALKCSQAFDRDVRARSVAVSSSFGQEYADIIEASVRQTFAALELTVPESDLNAAPSVFLKEISSDGNVNTVDLIFQSWPIFISLNPEYIRLLLQPILTILELPPSQGWPRPWVIHDIGFAYPNAPGHADGNAEQMPLFETSSLFILLLAYQKFSTNTTYVQQYIPLLKGYAQYLVDNTLYPVSQLISVDAIPASANQTGLAIQSVIGLKAASVLLKNATLSEIAASYGSTIYNQGLGLDGEDPTNSTHFTYNYGLSETWNVLFPAFSDVLLDLKTFPAEAWEMQSKWYESQMQQGGLVFAGPITELKYTGVPLTWGLTDWNIVAAGASSLAVQETIIKTTHAFMTNGLNTIPFGTKYDVEGPNLGKWIGNKARSTVGSHFALLALQQGTWGTKY